MKLKKTLLFMLLSLILLSSCSGKTSFEVVSHKTIIEWRENNNKVYKWLESIDQLSSLKKIESFTTDTHTYIWIGSGSKPTGGYEVNILRVEETKNNIVIVAEDRSPKKGQPLTNAVEYPKVIVKFKKTDKHIEVDWINN